LTNLLQGPYCPPKNSRGQTDGDLLGPEIDLETSAGLAKLRF